MGAASAAASSALVRRVLEDTVTGYEIAKFVAHSIITPRAQRSGHAPSC